MKANFSKCWHFLLFFLLPFIAQAQKEHHYLVFEEKEGKKNEKPIKEVFFNEKGDFVKAFAFREKDTLEIGKSYNCLNKDCIKARYKGTKFKEKKNTISVTEIDDFHHTKIETTYFFEEEKLIKEVVKEFPFSPQQTLYFYDNRQRIVLIIETFDASVHFTTQIEYESRVGKIISIEKTTYFGDGEINERKLIYIKQD